MAVPISELFVTVGADITGVTSGLNSASAAITRFGNQIKNAGVDLTQGITVPVVALAGVVGGIGADFEHQFTRVAKTVDATGPALEALRQGLIDLSTTPEAGAKSASDLAKIAEVAGQIGLPTEDILNFTKITAQLSVTTGIAADQIASDFARIGTLTNVSAGDWQKLGSAITELGNTMPGTEADIIAITTRMAGTLSSLRVPAQDILGIASAVSGLGIEAEAGGTSVQRIFLDMASAIAGTAAVTPEAAKKIQDLHDRITDLGTSLQTAQTRQATFGRNTPAAQVQETAAQIEKYRRELEQAKAELGGLGTKGAAGDLEAFASAAGVTSSEFKRLFAENPAKAFSALIHGLAAVSAESPTELVSTLAKLGINDARLITLITGLAHSSDLLDRGIAESNKGWTENTALTDEVSKSMQDTINQFDLMINRLKALAINSWPAFRSAAADAMGFVTGTVIPKLQELVGWWATLDPSVQRNILVFGALAAALGPVLVGLGILITIIGALLSPITLVLVAIALLAAAWVTNFGDIQGKTAAVVTFIQTLFKILTDTVFPAIAPAIQTAFAVFDTIKTFMGTWIGFITRIVILLVTLWDRALREIGGFFDTFLKPPLMAVAGWINDFVIQPLLALLRTIGTIASGLGITNIGGFDVGAAITSAEAAVSGISQGVAAGGPGTANDIVVNINNPTLLDQSMGDRFAQQMQDVLIDLLVNSERRTTPLPQPGLPGQPF